MHGLSLFSRRERTLLDCISYSISDQIRERLLTSDPLDLSSGKIWNRMQRKEMADAARFFLLSTSAAPFDTKQKNISFSKLKKKKRLIGWNEQTDDRERPSCVFFRLPCFSFFLSLENCQRSDGRLDERARAAKTIEWREKAGCASSIAALSACVRACVKNDDAAGSRVHTTTYAAPSSLSLTCCSNWLHHPRSRRDYLRESISLAKCWIRPWLTWHFRDHFQGSEASERSQYP